MGSIMANAVVVIILLVLVTAAVSYIVRAKKKGQKCIGCPYASGCGENCHCDSK